MQWCCGVRRRGGSEDRCCCSLRPEGAAGGGELGAEEGGKEEGEGWGEAELRPWEEEQTCLSIQSIADAAGFELIAGEPNQRRMVNKGGKSWLAPVS